MGSQKNIDLHFVVNLCVYYKCNAPKEPRQKPLEALIERNLSLYSVRNYLLRFRQISEVDILVQKMWISTVPQKIGIPVLPALIRISMPLSSPETNPISSTY